MKQQNEKFNLRALLIWVLVVSLATPEMSFGRVLGGGGDGPANGGGTSGNPGDQNGGGAGEILFGIAAIVARVAPMFVASTESQKEQNIAQTQSEAQIQQAEIQNATQKELAQMSAQTALTQAQYSKDIAQMNNDAQTQRNQINLAAAQQQRNDQRQIQQEQATYQRQMEAQRVAIAERQADESIRIAKETLEAKKLEAALKVANGASGAGNSAQGATSPLAAALTQYAMGANPTARGVARPASQPTGRGLAPAPSARLLASVEDFESNSAIRGLVQKRKVPVRQRLGLSATASRSGAGPLKNRGLVSSGLSVVAAGSFPEERARTSRPAFKVAEVAPVIVEATGARPKASVIRSH